MVLPNDDTTAHGCKELARGINFKFLLQLTAIRDSSESRP